MLIAFLGLFPLILTPLFPRELFLWGGTIFSSRSFTSELFAAEKVYGSFPVLYPVLDTFSHRIGAKVEWQFEKGDFTLSVKEKVEQGQQIFNNYSAKGNEDCKHASMHLCSLIVTRFISAYGIWLLHS